MDSFRLPLSSASVSLRFPNGTIAIRTIACLGRINSAVVSREGKSRRIDRESISSDSGLVSSNADEKRERDVSRTRQLFTRQIFIPKIQRSGKLRVGIKEGGNSLSPPILSKGGPLWRSSDQRSRGQTPGFSSAPVFD